MRVHDYCDLKLWPLETVESQLTDRLGSEQQHQTVPDRLGGAQTVTLTAMICPLGLWTILLTEP